VTGINKDGDILFLVRNEGDLDWSKNLWLAEGAVVTLDPNTPDGHPLRWFTGLSDRDVNGRIALAGWNEWSIPGTRVSQFFANAYRIVYDVTTDVQTFENLGSLGGTESEANAINGKGHIVGSSRLATKSGAYRAYLHAPGGVMKDLGTLGGDYSVGNSLNDSGDVIGWAETSQNTGYGFKYRTQFLYMGGKMWDLRNLIDNKPAEAVFSINDTIRINNSRMIFWNPANGPSFILLPYTP
jgi:probable HAF family extracellular repeat protein